MNSPLDLLAFLPFAFSDRVPRLFWQNLFLTAYFEQLTRMGGIKFILMVNKQGQTRLASYYEWIPMNERTALESEIIRRCLGRTEFQCSFLEYRGYRVVYRRYASLFFVVAIDGDEENELGILEFIHCLVETMDKYFDSVCELDIMYHIDKAYYIVDEMVANGAIVESNKVNIIKPLALLDKEIKKEEGSFFRKG